MSIGENQVVEKCICGRVKAIAHCPMCGLRNFYAIASRAFVVPLGDGMPGVRIRSYRCRVCDDFFTDLDRDNCKAPQKLLSMKAQRAFDLASNTLSYEEAKKQAFEKLARLSSRKRAVYEPEPSEFVDSDVDKKEDNK